MLIPLSKKDKPSRVHEAVAEPSEQGCREIDDQAGAGKRVSSRAASESMDA
jgi:hypothetical protein